MMLLGLANERGRVFPHVACECFGSLLRAIPRLAVLGACNPTRAFDLSPRHGEDRRFLNIMSPGGRQSSAVHNCVRESLNEKALKVCVQLHARRRIRLPSERNGPHSDRCLPEPCEQCEVGVNPHVANPELPQRRQGVLVLESSELALYGRAATVEALPLVGAVENLREWDRSAFRKRGARRAAGRRRGIRCGKFL